MVLGAKQAVIGLSLLLLPVLAAPAPAHAADSGAPQLARQLSAQLAADWPARQRASGEFDDYVLPYTGSWGRDLYGPAMLGAALVQVGTRTANPDLLGSGLRSIRYALTTRAGLSEADRSAWPAGFPRGYAYPFSLLALADTWNVDRGQWLNGSPATQLAEGDWRTLLQGAAPLTSPTVAQRPTNQLLLERVAWQTLLASGLPGSGVNALLADPTASAQQVTSWTDAWLSKARLGQASSGALGRSLLLSDYPNWPHAYHALSVGLLARLAHWSSASRRPVLLGALREALRSSRLLVSPRGDLGYAGRSAMMPWTLAFTAYGALASAADPNVPADEAAADRRLAQLALERLRSDYLDGRLGLLLMPSQRAGVKETVGALDEYPSAVPYTGLTLLALEWAGALADGPAVEQLPRLSETLGGSNLRSRLGVLNTDSLWLGLRSWRHDYGSARPDLRFDLGPQAAQQQVAGSWQWLLPVRPLHPADGLGSWLRLIDGARALLASSSDLSVSSNGQAIQQVRFFPAGQPPVSVQVTYRQAACGGLRVTLTPGSAVALETAWWLPRSTLARSGLSWSGGGLTVSLSREPQVRVLPSAPSATHSALQQLNLRFAASAQPLTVELCRS